MTLPSSENYRDSIFTPPGGSGLLSRVVFHSYHRFLNHLFTNDDTTALKHSLFLFGTAIFVTAWLVSATPADLIMVFGDSGYEQPSEIFGVDNEGKPVKIAEFYQSSRRVIHLNDSGPEGLDSKVVRSFVATEDNNFYFHPGIDVIGILRAMAVNIRSGEIREGASTITQQVARLRFLSNERSLVRKAREAFLSFLIELRFSKRRIMELYLNEVPLGHNTNGIEAASRFYFNKGVFELSWGEAAVLASLTTRPRDFSPLRFPDTSRQKVSIVLKKLVENGELTVQEAAEEFKRLDETFYATLFERSPNENAFNSRLNLHPYVTEFVKYSLPSRFTGRRLLTGGLRIYTTINVDHQTAAEETFPPWLVKLSEQRKRAPFRNYYEFDNEFGPAWPLIRRLFDLPLFQSNITREERDFQKEFRSEFRDEFALLNLISGDDNVGAAMEQSYRHNDPLMEDQSPVEGSLISMRPNTGEITAVIGGSRFISRNQNLRFVQARRPPGSSIKPLLYASGIEYSMSHADERKRLSAATVLDDSPPVFISQDLTEYTPENFGSSYDGEIRLRRALMLSKNAVAIRVYERMGPRALNPGIERLLQMDEGSPPRRLPKEATVALGTYEVTPLEMARAYGTFASNGREIHPYVISHITDPDGNVVWDNRPVQAKRERRQVVSPGTAEIITSMMRDVVSSGTGVGAGLSGWDAVGKTGTTNRGADAWFVGYTPVLITAVQIGYDTPRTLGYAGTGGAIAAPIWGRYMNKALRHEHPQSFSFPGSNLIRVEICELSGKLPSDRCKDRMVELFHPGTQPHEQCKDHGDSTEDKPDKPSEIFREEDY